jgi:hypothetical protein
MIRFARHWISAVAGLAALWFGGGSTLPWPPLADPARLPGWWSHHGPAVGAFSVARVVLMAVGAYWLGLLTLIGLAVLIRGRRPARLGAPGGSAALRLALGAAVSGGLIAGCAGATSPGQAREPPPTLQYLGPAAPVPLDRRAGTPAARLSPGPRHRSSRPQLPRRTATAATGRSRWVVRPGDDLWSISATTLAEAWARHGAKPGPSDVAGYWVRVIAVNRYRLPDPADPSLIFPGDVIVLPGVPRPP